MERKRRVLLLLIAGAAAVMTACTVPIGRVLHDPGRYSNRQVTIQGNVTNVVGALGTGAYQVEDGTGKIFVLSAGRGVPGKGARVKVSGTVTSGVNLMGRNFGTTIRESHHKVKW